MKIGFDVSQTGNGKAGCGFFAENLIQHLAKIDSTNQYTLYHTFGDHYWDSQSKATYHINLPNFHNGIKHSNLEEAKRFWQTSPDHIEKQLQHIDILHTNNFFCPPKLPHTKLIYTLYDLSFIEHPDCSTEHNRIACFDGVFKASLNADLIIAISHFSRTHFLQTFPHYPADRIVTVHPANRFTNDANDYPQSKKLSSLKSQQFWLNVGTIEPRKNIKFLLRAYAKLVKQQEKSLPLVLAGKPGWIENDIENYINDLGIANQVHLLGYVNNNELQWLYKNCFCLVYPSIFEGFGLPILEAMNFGAPIITSNTSSIPEIVGKAGMLINPTKEEELIQAMLDVATNKNHRENLKLLALEQAKLFSWPNSAKKVLTLYQDILSPSFKKISAPLTNMALS